MKQGIAAFALGVVALGTPLVSFAQAPPPPPPPPGAMQPPPPGAQQPPPNLQPPPPAPPGAQPYPYPYPYAQPGQPPYASPYGYPPGAYPPPRQKQPDTLPFKENEPIPPGYKVEERIRKGLVIPGAIIFGTFYFLSVVAGASNLDSDEAPYGALFVPVIGPFIVAATGNIRGTGSSGGSSGAPNMFFILDGLVQIGGGAMLLAGIYSKKKVLAREKTALVVQPEFFVGPGSVGMKLQF